MFIDKYLAIDLDYFSKYDRQIKRDSESSETNQPSKPKGNELPEYFFRQKDERKVDLMSAIKKLLDADYLAEEQLIDTQQQKYIRTFLLIYLSYLNEVILNKKPEVKKSNVGYVMSVEKMLLDNLVGTKENFKEIVLASGVIRESDPTKKLKVITRGEELSVLLQQASGLKISCKSYFVVFQLHEDYIHFTLNRVVTASDSNNKESSIIIEDKILPIRNIYKSLFMNMWKHLTREGDFVDRCGDHSDDENYDCLEFISCETKKMLFNDFKTYVEKNVSIQIYIQLPHLLIK
ncbi:MAG: hypothetical protein JSY10_20920 [Paenibacillus sp.]|nr:hypothetical protein [Paenibacillus sp.]